MKKIIIGISGASGAIYGIRLLEVLKDVDLVETHLIMSKAAGIIAAKISSGSFKTDGMVVIPCSMKTLAGITYSFSDNLLLRAADVVLKDRRRLIIVPRETPLHLGHLRMMVQVSELGAIIVPPMPAFYHRPRSIEDIINQTVNRVLDLVDIDLPADLFVRWQGGRAGGSS
jgi:4-hydroxy-3-polyprenylbenzoate decarboxylase